MRKKKVFVSSVIKQANQRPSYMKRSHGGAAIESIPPPFSIFQLHPHGPHWHCLKWRNFNKGHRQAVQSSSQKAQDDFLVSSTGVWTFQTKQQAQKWADIYESCQLRVVCFSVMTTHYPDTVQGLLTEKKFQLWSRINKHAYVFHLLEVLPFFQKYLCI